MRCHREIMMVATTCVKKDDTGVDRCQNAFCLSPAFCGLCASCESCHCRRTWSHFDLNQSSSPCGQCDRNQNETLVIKICISHKCYSLEQGTACADLDFDLHLLSCSCEIVGRAISIYQSHEQLSLLLAPPTVTQSHRCMLNFPHIWSFISRRFRDILKSM